MNKAFEEWYHRHVHVQCLHEWQMFEYKRVLYNAWKQGRKHQKKQASAYGDVVRWG